MDACKVKLTTSRAGDGFSQQAGDTIVVSPQEAERMRDAGQIVEVEGETYPWSQPPKRKKAAAKK